MKRREVKGESRKLNHQLTGFVETQLAGGTEGDGGRGGGGGGRRWAPGSHKQTINTVTPEGRNRKMRMWQEFWYPALTLQFTHTCTHTCPYRPGHTFIKGPVVLRSSAAALWHAGLQWFAVIKQPPVKFKQVFCNSLIHGQGDGLKWDCRVWSIKLIRRFEEGSLSRIPLFLQSDPGWKWELIRKRGSCCPVLMLSAVCVALRLTALSGSGQSCTKSPFIPVWLIWVHTSGGRWLKKLERTGGKPTHRVILVHLTAYFNFMFNGK